jgi:osmotically-inducible protein OsmY
MKNDMQIQQEVITELDRDDNVPPGSVGVEVHHGVVKLASPDGDPSMKRNAELAARRVAGVTNIVVDMGMGQRC